ncbi:hypothetical protein SO802_013169 [Lithocarpus litseifolius]|uniref:Aminotransferase-like plant mobile domain-containing protein n=1 Tax=Lithocarpus litseifolius TaxID=425828 RepID=A0AAW2D7H2_9ROSI
MLFRVRVGPGVLMCRRRSCELPQHGLDPWIARYITALVKRWRLEMHTFHLPHREMGITLQDIEVMLGVPVDGLPMTGSVKLDWLGLCRDLFGHRPLDSISHPHENMSILVGARIRVSWLKAWFKGPLTTNATKEVVQQHARYHILMWLGSILFMDKSADRVLAPIQGIRDKGDANWRSIDVGAVVGIFEVPTDMPCYEATTTVGGGRSPRQLFGMKQALLDLVDTSIDLHGISLQGKLERDWVQEHAVYIDQWANRGERLANASTLDGDTMYLAAYMESYRRTTKLYITCESMYWEILVESNVELLSQCEPDSQVFNHLKSMLDLVEELSRVALGNAPAMASEASIQATSRGGRGGGSGGRGRGGGRGGGREDEDDLSNFQL